MARIRSLHPGFATDENFITVSVAARLFFLLLLTECDDQGIFEWKPKTLKMKLLPADNIDVEELLGDLLGIGAVTIFHSDEDRKYGAVRNFRKFQRPKSPNAIHPIIPDIRTWVGLDASASEAGHSSRNEISEMQPDEPGPFPGNGEIRPQMEDGGGRREDGRHREGGEGGRSPRGTRLAGDWSVPDDWLTAAAEARREHGLPACNLRLEAANFRDYWTGKPGKDGVKLDWRATWLNWARRANSKADPAGQQQAKPFPGYVPMHPGAGG